MNDLHCERGSSRPAAANNTRSAELRCGRCTWRRKTASSRRRTTISSSLNSSERGAQERELQ